MPTAHAVLPKNDGRTKTAATEAGTTPREFDLYIKVDWERIPEVAENRSVRLRFVGKDLTDDHVSQVVSTLVDTVRTIDFHGREDCQTYQFSVKWHTSRPAFEHVIDEVIERIRKELLS